VKFWQALSFTETDQLVTLARCCEEAGFHGVLLSDHVFVPGRLESRYPYSSDGTPPFSPATEHPEPWAAIAAMAQVTTRLFFSTSVYLAGLRHPLHVAKSVATASRLSGGRVALGVGVGWVREEFEVLGEDFATRGARLEEQIEVMRKVWGGGLVEHHGRFYRFPPLAMEPRPAAEVPVWIGGRSPRALRRAARYDGWLSSGETPESARAVLASLHELREQAGLAGRAFEAILALAGEPDLELYHRLEERGATGFVAYPPAYLLGAGGSLDAKRRAIGAWGERVIARYGAGAASAGAAAGRAGGVAVWGASQRPR
jgi:probable F420-dependent oxidoreductase